MADVDRGRLRALIAEERAAFDSRHPRSRALFEQARGSLLAGVPMSWMAKWAGGHPVYLAEAKGARVVDVDGNEFVDLCLGDTGAMAGHSPEPVVRAVAERFGADGGATAMLPSEDAAWVGSELAHRFGLPLWQLTLSATDANRWALRLARQVTGRQRVMVFSHCYHGSVDESFVVLEGDAPRSRPGNVGPPVDPTTTTRVADFNDLDAVERELAAGDVACLLTEPALTNIGIVLPEVGFLDGLRELTRQAGTLLAIDETHTLSAGPGGCTAAWGLEPDILTIGKSIGGGIPIGAFGVSTDLGSRIEALADADLEDTGGVGGTLAGNALSSAAARATLSDVLTDEAFEGMISLATRLRDGVQATIGEHELPWSIVQLGARAEYRFAMPAPRSGTESAAAEDAELDEYMHLYTLNRGVLMTPFHNMALTCPATTAADIERHNEVFGEAVRALVG
jgi:glutamate-1-semialdehyde 2,1-aminomutase